MKQFRVVFIFALIAVLSATAFVVPVSSTSAAQHDFSVKEYEEFHHVLHPLEHDALPKKDYRRIRAKAGDLTKRGGAIVKVGIPAGMSEEQKEEFSKELNRFNDALSKFQVDARRGRNAQLKMSYSAVHDSFEMLAGMLPRR
ncbi:MAG: hypothetical protein ACR2G5_18595 [Pyrinomonadaceae bacterium]